MSIALRPWPAPKTGERKPEELKTQIAQLVIERGGHVRNITEHSLQDDIIAGKDIADDSSEQAEKKADRKEAQTREERQQDIQRLQQEMWNEMEWAKFALNNATDLLSLVLSVDPKQRAPATFSYNFRSQGLDQGLPFGSFGVSRENHEHHVRTAVDSMSLREYAHRQEVVSKGARMAALDSATDDILKAAKKLEREVRRETKYWHEIVSISEKGWPIQRLRQNVRHVPYAVRYGLPEASNHFKARGLAPLRMDKDGSIILDPALALKPKTLRVRVSESGNIIGTSCLSVEHDDDSNMAIEKSIQLARDSLFEEELYHAMSMESRKLMAYGVEYRDSVIHVDVSNHKDQHSSRKLLIDIIPRADGTASDQQQTHDWLAKSVAEGLRLLLAHEHSMRLYRRSQLPTPLGKAQGEEPLPALLRTVLAVFNHVEGVESLYRYLETVTKTLQNAGVPVTLETTREASWTKLAERLAVPSKKATLSSDRLLGVFLRPFDGQVTLSLPSMSGTQTEDIKISTLTTMGEPTFGTEHRLTLPSSLHSDLGLFQQVKLPNVDETISYLDWVLSLHIAHRQLKKDFSQRASAKANEARVSIRSRGNKNFRDTDYDVTIELKDGKLEVTTHNVNAKESKGARQSHVWDGNSKGQSLTEMLNSLVG